jgi:hypothetical protein
MVSSPLGNCADASQDDLKGDSEMNHHDLITAPLAKFSSQVPPRGRPIKFTPERVQQIRNLVERGKSREEIAELIEVTIGSLQVSCSKIGISLRRPRLDNGIRLLPRGKPVPSNGGTTPDLSCDVGVPLQPIAEGSRQDSQPGPPSRYVRLAHCLRDGVLGAVWRFACVFCGRVV